MAKSYLHKQTILIAIICILAVGATAGYVYTQPTPTLSESATVRDIQPDTNIISTSSTEWKKQFFDITGGTNAITGSKKLATSTNDTPLTLTDQVSRDLFARYIQLKQNNLDTNPQLVQDSIDQTVANAQIGANQPKIYYAKDVTISKDSSVQAIHNYANTVAAILIKYSPSQSPADIASNAFDKNDMTLLAQIDPIIAQFKKMSQLLIVTPVPVALMQNHLDLINSITSMISISQGLRNIEGDPMQSLVSLGNYVNTQTNVFNSLVNIQTYLNTNHITFTTTESGILFSQLKPQ